MWSVSHDQVTWDDAIRTLEGCSAISMNDDMGKGGLGRHADSPQCESSQAGEHTLTHWNVW